MNELEIDLGALFRLFLKSWIWILASAIVGFGIGRAASHFMAKKYASHVVFVPERDAESGQMLSGLGALTGRMGLSGGDAESPPYLAHFEEFLKSRNFASSVQLAILPDTTADLIRSAYPKLKLDSITGFWPWLVSSLKVSKKEGLYKLEVQTREPELSYRLTKQVFKTFEERMRIARMAAIDADLQFIQNLVSKNMADLRKQSDALRLFWDRNRSATSPELRQTEQGLMLDLKLAEEKYVFSVKELETVKVKKEKQIANVVLIESPFLEPFPIFPVPSKISLAGMILAVLAFLSGLAIWRRPIWIVGRKSG